jgi:quercetin dioxygenase-like cupin family protein
VGEVMKRNGSRTEVLADLEQLAVFEFLRPGRTRGAGPHFHAAHVDSFVVLEGELEVLTDAEPLTLTAGDAVAVPPGVVHGFNNSSAAPLRLLNVHAPARRFVEYIRCLYTNERVEAADYDQYPPDDAPGGEPVVARGGDGERFDRGNRVVTIRFDLPHLSLVEIEFDPSFEVPRHTHDDHVDSFFVLDGAVEFTHGDETLTASPGTFVAAPPGTQHGFRNPGTARARVLNLHAPDAGFAASVRIQ